MSNNRGEKEIVMAAPRKEDTKAMIIKTAREMLEEKSFSDISLAAIATKAGISKGTLYYHFKNREEILFAVMDDYLDSQKEELILWIEDSSKDTSLPRLLKYILERDTSTHDMRFHLIIEAVSGNEKIREKILMRYHEFHSMIAKIIASKIDVIPGEYLSWLVLLLSDGLLIHKLMADNELDTDSFIKDTEKYVKLILSLKDQGV